MSRRIGGPPLDTNESWAPKPRREPVPGLCIQELPPPTRQQSLQRGPIPFSTMVHPTISYIKYHPHTIPYHHKHDVPPPDQWERAATPRLEHIPCPYILEPLSPQRPKRLKKIQTTTKKHCGNARARRFVELVYFGAVALAQT
jgi:hypothetical protein